MRPWIFRREAEGWIRVELRGRVATLNHDAVGRGAKPRRRQVVGVVLGRVKRSGRTWSAKWTPAAGELRAGSPAVDVVIEHGHRTQDSAALRMFRSFCKRTGEDLHEGAPPGRIGARTGDPRASTRSPTAQCVIADTRAPRPGPLEGADLTRGARLRRARLAVGAKLADIARAAGVDVPTLSRIERGHAIPSAAVWTAAEERVKALGSAFVVEWGACRQPRYAPRRGMLPERQRFPSYREAAQAVEYIERVQWGRSLDRREWEPAARGRDIFDPLGGVFVIREGAAILWYREETNGPA